MWILLLAEIIRYASFFQSFHWSLICKCTLLVTHSYARNATRDLKKTFSSSIESTSGGVHSDVSKCWQLKFTKSDSIHWILLSSLHCSVVCFSSPFLLSAYTHNSKTLLLFSVCVNYYWYTALNFSMYLFLFMHAVLCTLYMQLGFLFC